MSELRLAFSPINPGPDLPVIAPASTRSRSPPQDGANAPLRAVASLGTNPTFVEGGGLVLEVHVLDWDGDLYDRRVRTTFVARLRDEARHDSIDALLAQIRLDIEQARAALA